MELADKQFNDLVCTSAQLVRRGGEADTVKRKQLQERIAYYKVTGGVERLWVCGYFEWDYKI